MNSIVKSFRERQAGDGWDVLKHVSAIFIALGAMVTIKRGIVAYYGSSEAAFGSPNWVEKGWSYVYNDIAQQNEFLIGVVMGSVWATFWYWSIGLAFAVLDLTAPKSLLKFKIQEDRNTPVPMNKFLNCVRVVLFNQVVMTTALTVPFFYIWKWLGCGFSVETIPTFERFARDMVGIILIEDIGFFYSHYLFHQVPGLYKRFHKLHHTWQAPIAIAARFAHPVEDVFANMLPFLLGPTLMRSHQVTLWAWTLIGHTATLLAHSGWHFPLLPSPELHDAHHKLFNVHFSSLGFLDWLHGTSTRMVGSSEAKRHKVYFSLNGIRELIPDDASSRKEKKAA